jgi:hypothetical protein
VLYRCERSSDRKRLPSSHMWRCSQPPRPYSQQRAASHHTGSKGR